MRGNWTRLQKPGNVSPLIKEEEPPPSTWEEVRDTTNYNDVPSSPPSRDEPFMNESALRVNSHLRADIFSLFF